jgi:hypothetical protein
LHSPEPIPACRHVGSALSPGRVDSIPSACKLSPRALGRQNHLGAASALGRFRSLPLTVGQCRIVGGRGGGEAEESLGLVTKHCWKQPMPIGRSQPVPEGRQSAGRGVAEHPVRHIPLP